MSLEIDERWDAIVNLMQDEIREDLHSKLAPTTNMIFLNAYLEKDPSFHKILKSEFGIDFA